MVRWTLRACAILLIVTMLFGILNACSENRRFNTTAKKAVVEPITEYKETTTTKKKLGFIPVSTTKSYSARIYFTTNENKRIGVNKDLSEEVLARFKKGDKVFIDYLADEPTMTRFPGEGPSPFWALLFLVAIVATTVYFWKPKERDDEGSA